jgi:cell wall protein DAN4
MDPTFQPQNQNDTPNEIGLDASATPAISATPTTSTAGSTTPTTSTTDSAIQTTPAADPTISTTPADPTTSAASNDSAMGGSELDSLMSELNNYRPENDTTLGSTGAPTNASISGTSNTSSDSNTSDRPQFSPSENLTQTATVSASMQGSDLNTTSLTDNSFDQAPTTQASATPTQEATESDEEEDEDKPLTAAAPVPGSIGSAVSYADVEKKQAEEAAKQAKNQNKPKIKLSSTAILAIIVGGLFVITGIIFAIIMLSSPKKAPAEASGKNKVAQAESKSLTCVRPLSTNETAEIGAAYGNFERQFEFKNDNLESISENYVYQFNGAEAATTAKTSIDSNNSNANTITVVNVNQLKKITKITTENLDSYIKGIAELNSATGHDLNSLLIAENQTGLSCSTVE